MGCWGWTYLTQERKQCQTFVKTRMNLWAPYHTGNLVTRRDSSSWCLLVFSYLINTRKLEMFCVLLSNFSPQHIAVAVNLTAGNHTFLQFHF